MLFCEEDDSESKLCQCQTFPVHQKFNQIAEETHDTKILGKLSEGDMITCSNSEHDYMFKVNNRNTRTRCEICSKLTIKTPERRHWRRSGVFIVNFEHISHLVLVFLLLTLNM